MLPAVVAVLLALTAGAASAQVQFKAPDGRDVNLSLQGCTNASGFAVPCGDAAPVITRPSGAGAAIVPFRGVPSNSAVTSVGTTSTQMLPANSNRLGYSLQIPPFVAGGVTANTVGAWCDDTGAAAVLGPPSTYVAPGGQMLSRPLLSSTAAVNCIAVSAGVPVSMRQFLLP